jgi:hypothetical protein
LSALEDAIAQDLPMIENIVIGDRSADSSTEIVRLFTAGSRLIQHRKYPSRLLNGRHIVAFFDDNDENTNRPPRSISSPASIIAG